MAHITKEELLERLFHELSCDALGYSNILMQQQYEYWKERSADDRALLNGVGFSVTVSSTINRGGAALS